MLSCLVSLTAYQVTAGRAGRSPVPGVRRGCHERRRYRR